MNNLPHITFNLWSSLLVFGFLQGVLLAGIIIWGYPKNKTRILLAGLIGIIASNLFNYLLLNAGLYQQMPHLANIALPGLMLLGPCYFLWVKAILNKGNLQIKKTDSWHLLPFVCAIVYLWPFFRLDASTKISLLQAQQSLSQLPLTIEVYLFLLLQISQSFIYIYSAIRLLKKNARTNKSQALAKKYHWLHKFSYAFLIYWTIDFLGVIWYIMQGNIDKEAYYITMLTSAILVNILIVFAIKNNPVFTKILLDKEPIKYKNAKVSSNDLQKHLKEILRLMETKKLYLDAELSLPKLSQALNISQQMVSQILNTELGKSFYEFVNEYRFQEARQRLKDPAYSHLTILGIAYEAGFNNKNTFNKVFKKHEGITPSQYRKIAPQINS